MSTAAPKRDAPEGVPAAEEGRGSADTLEVTPLGAGSEVGRSCILLSYKGKNVMLDCGIHPGLVRERWELCGALLAALRPAASPALFSLSLLLTRPQAGMASLPYFDDVDLSTVRARAHAREHRVVFADSARARWMCCW